MDIPGISARRILRALPTAQAIHLPEGWLAGCENDRSVYESLYRWLAATLRVPKEGLHNRTYIGSTLAGALRAFEKKRLQRKTRLSGKALERAVNWSDMGSGPMELFADKRITGSVIILVPEKDEVFQEAWVGLLEEDRQRLIKRIRATASGDNFFHWLLSQLTLPAAIGDLARDAAEDSTWPKEANTYQELAWYLERCHACLEALETLQEAWEAYMAQYPDRIVPIAWCDYCREQIYSLDQGLLSCIDNEEFAMHHLRCDGYDDESRAWLMSQSLWETDAPAYPSLNLYALSQATDVMANTRDFARHCGASPHAIAKLLLRLRFLGLGKEGLFPVTSPTSSWVYFIQAGAAGAIKIGFSRRDPRRRLAALQTAHPERLCLLGAMPGKHADEKQTQRRFDAHKISGEWFHPHADVLSFIASLPAQGSDV